MVLETSTDSLMGETPRTLRHSKPKDESLFEMIRLGIVNHQMGLSINCLLLLALTYLFFPSLRSNTSRYFVLSYKDDQTGLYKAGFDDLYFVVLWIVVFTGLRAATMDYVLMPWARNMGIKKKKHTLRFAEQSWMIIYYSVTWPAGIYLYVTSSYYGNLPAMWADYPNVHMAPLMKLYYLIQFAFWIQQIVVVHIEERRKDHWQMFSHHIITCILMFASYGSYQTKVGHVILVVMDVVDIVLPLAKNLKYAGYPIACDIMFGVFILTWFVTRHIFFPMICWSVYRDIPVVMPGGCYDPSTRMKDSTNGGNEIWRNIVHAYKGGEGPVCFNEVLRLSYLGLLLTLQLLITVWFTMICRVAYGVLSGKGAEDSRSDDEDEGDEEEEEPQPSPVRLGKRPAQTRTGSGRLPKEEEVGVEQLRFVKRTSPPARRTKARASGISIPGHTDHKELLGRIGCDKPSGS
ncbi:hypothetical protein ANO11243_007000 [Dothideomycetidae sp. 11243]|nr:hypothetical protein ANO11243_007000 [fungal sp. No.11243]